MNFSLSDDHRLLRDSAKSFLDAEISLRPLLVPGATVRDAGYAENWAKIGRMGWAGLLIPEEFGGAGLGCVDLTMIVEELGRTLTPSPLFGTLLGTLAVLKGGGYEPVTSMIYYGQPGPLAENVEETVIAACRRVLKE